MIKNILLYAGILLAGLSVGFALQSTNSTDISVIKNVDTSSHFANAKAEIILYSTQWCPYCQQVKTFLTENNMHYLDRDIEQGDTQIERLYQSLDGQGVPKIIIGNTIIHGFNLEAIKAAYAKHRIMVAPATI